MFHVPRYPKLSLLEERRLIARAQRGSRKTANEIILRHMSFVSFRLHKLIIPSLARIHGEDIVSDCIPVLYKQIKTYKLRYRDQRGNLKPVRFVSYIWKRVDGFIVDSIRKETNRSRIEVPVHD